MCGNVTGGNMGGETAGSKWMRAARLTNASRSACERERERERE